MKNVTTIVGAAALALILAACGTSAAEDGGGGGTTSEEVLAAAQETTEANLAGTDRDLPTDGPAAQEGKTVWVLACATIAPGCSMAAEGFVEAAGELGWEARLADGKLDPSVYNAQIRAAAAAKADAVVLFGVDCAQVKGAVVSAQEAGTKVFGANALDCDDELSGGGPGDALLDGDMLWGPDNTDYATFTDDYVGPGQADWIIAATDGQANVIQLRQDDSAGTHHIGKSAHDRLAECAGCTVTVVPYTGEDLATGRLQAKTSAALQKNLEADVVLVPVDAAISLGVGSAVDQARASGRELLLVGQEGVPASVKLISDGTQSFALGRPWTWTGWAAADALNRLFAGEEPVDAGFGFGAMDAEHPPAGETYDGNDDSAPYKDNYRAIWGGGR
ncbi:sugar ABC transporter substrate-binding protein [Ornithinimicrobium faecis]|uniref:sugar ABC transporter substrate-binding protein n=1 Tax=Ornithinimicrobium faecis TaxID=2934158 RepID=UPI0021187285|nr:substrate-binding domain-containing protein [Ornithinimicrobium sp. HY1745]